MNKLIIKLVDFFGLFNKTRIWLKGKKTIISSILGMLTSAAAIMSLMIPWIDGNVDFSHFIDQATIPATTFWASATFLFSATHTNNVIEAKGIK